MSERRSSPKKRRPDPYAAFSYEMERAESTRRAAVAAGAAITVLLVVVAAVVAAAVAGARPSAEDQPTVVASTLAPPARSSAIETSVAETTTTPNAPFAELTAQEEAKPAPDSSLAKSAAGQPATPKPPTPTTAEPQRFSIAIGDVGYQPAAISAKAGVPIVLSVAQGEGCAAGFLMPELGVALDNSAGPITAELGKLEPGEYRYTCGMDMVSGLLMVR